MRRPERLARLCAGRALRGPLEVLEPIALIIVLIIVIVAAFLRVAAAATAALLLGGRRSETTVTRTPSGTYICGGLGTDNGSRPQEAVFVAVAVALLGAVLRLRGGIIAVLLLRGLVL